MSVNFSVAGQYAGYQGSLAHAQTVCTGLSFLLPHTEPGNEVIWDLNQCLPPYTRVNKHNSLVSAHCLLSACFFPGFAPG